MRREVNKQHNNNTPGGVLTRLKNKLLAKMRIDITRFTLLVEKYAIKLNGGKKNSTSQSTRTNLMGAFNRDWMSINTFFRFLSSLELKSVEIRVIVKTKDDEEFTVSENIKFRNEDPVNVNEEGDKDENK